MRQHKLRLNAGVSTGARLVRPAAVSLHHAELELTDVAIIVATLSLSRIGLWSFDLCERQIVQTAAGPECLAVFAQEKALSQAASLAMTATSVVFSSADEFFVLVALSVAALLTSVCVFHCGLRGRRPNPKHNKSNHKSL